MIIKFVITHNPSPYKKPTKKQKPIKRSKYAQYLFDKGAGWNVDRQPGK